MSTVEERKMLLWKLAANKPTTNGEEKGVMQRNQQLAMRLNVLWLLKRQPESYGKEGK